MSSISITPITAAVRVGEPGTRLRLTRRGRRVLVALAAFPLAAGIAVAAVGGPAAVASSDSQSVVFDTVTVLPGDTLWAIAAEIAPAEDPRFVVDALVRLNVLGDGEVFAGQELAIPAEYSAGVR